MAWTHPICEPCWRNLEGEREPVRMKDAGFETCARCGRTTKSGIYVRADPATMPFAAREAT